MRRRRYVSPRLLFLLRPLFRPSRRFQNTYVLKTVGVVHGPVIMRERRRQSSAGYSGDERRRVIIG